jgi:hypothetical protein
LLLCGLLAGCGTKDHSAQTTADVQPGDTHLSQSKAISIAEKVAVKAGFKLSDYKPRTASVDVEYGSKKRFLTWSVNFEPQPWSPNHDAFIVFVDDQTKKAKLVSGF